MSAQSVYIYLYGRFGCQVFYSIRHALRTNCAIRTSAGWVRSCGLAIQCLKHLSYLSWVSAHCTLVDMCLLWAIPCLPFRACPRNDQYGPLRRLVPDLFVGHSPNDDNPSPHHRQRRKTGQLRGKEIFSELLVRASDAGTLRLGCLHIQ